MTMKLRRRAGPWVLGTLLLVLQVVAWAAYCRQYELYEEARWALAAGQPERALVLCRELAGTQPRWGFASRAESLSADAMLAIGDAMDRTRLRDRARDTYLLVAQEFASLEAGLQARRRLACLAEDQRGASSTDDWAMGGAGFRSE
ncbi:MAG: hypothetical protein HY814_03845 [Candidatus Riflebacteria bacterium]|nr:hypothetical protein [Candidatus Riflebacteria bacterium]